MNEARKTFEAIAQANGGTDFSLKQDGRYAVQKIQSRWTYFRLGWEAKAKREQPEQEREWIDLDEEEQKECWDEGGSQRAIYQNIASKLKDKNT